MFPDETRKRQERLSEQIYLLAEKMLDQENEEHLKVILKLQRIYESGFKHSYSDLFPVILNVFKEGNSYDVNYLSNNLDLIRNTLEMDYSNGDGMYDDIYLQFTKLCDHLNLQIGELSVFTKTESRANDANASIEVANKRLEDATQKLEKASEKASSIQTELIAVLSIFAAIVVTFSGGFTFLGSVMSSINGAEYYEAVILTAIVCGMVMFNTIFLLMYLVGKITDRNIYARCMEENCSCDEHSLKKCSGIRRIRKRLPYVFYFNLMCIVGILVICVVWYLNGNGYL